MEFHEKHINLTLAGLSSINDLFAIQVKSIVEHFKPEIAQIYKNEHGSLPSDLGVELSVYHWSFSPGKLQVSLIEISDHPGDSTMVIEFPLKTDLGTIKLLKV